MNRPNSSLDWVLSHWVHFAKLRFIFVYVLFCVSLYIACMCSIVTWWGGPGGIEAWSLGPLLPSVIWHCWLGHLTRKTRPRYDYNVFSGTLNPTQSINQLYIVSLSTGGNGQNSFLAKKLPAPQPKFGPSLEGIRAHWHWEFREAKIPLTRNNSNF